MIQNQSIIDRTLFFCFKAHQFQTTQGKTGIQRQENLEQNHFYNSIPRITLKSSKPLVFDKPYQKGEATKDDNENTSSFGWISQYFSVSSFRRDTSSISMNSIFR